MSAFIQGYTLGLAYVMPIGTQNIFVINTALTQRRSRIWLTTFCVFFCDIVCALACFYGVGGIMQSSRWLQLAVLGAGSLVVMWIGFSIFRDKSTLEGDEGKSELSAAKVFTTACFVTWANPQAWIDGSMMLGAFRTSLNGADGARFIIAVCLASLSWWVVMPTVVSLLQSRINNNVFRAINIICGAIIMAYGAKLLVSFVRLTAVMFG